jgi:hypothetical protein
MVIETGQAIGWLWLHLWGPRRPESQPFDTGSIGALRLADEYNVGQWDVSLDALNDCLGFHIYAALNFVAG